MGPSLLVVAALAAPVAGSASSVGLAVSVHPSSIELERGSIDAPKIVRAIANRSGKRELRVHAGQPTAGEYSVAVRAGRGSSIVLIVANETGQLLLENVLTTRDISARDLIQTISLLTLEALVAPRPELPPAPEEPPPRLGDDHETATGSPGARASVAVGPRVFVPDGAWTAGVVVAAELGDMVVVRLSGGVWAPIERERPSLELSVTHLEASLTGGIRKRVADLLLAAYLGPTLRLGVVRAAGDSVVTPDPLQTALGLAATVECSIQWGPTRWAVALGATRYIGYERFVADAHTILSLGAWSLDALVRVTWDPA